MILTRFNAVFLLVIAILMCGCATKEITKPVADQPLPWTSAGVDNHEDKFTFAIFSDLTGGERPDVFRIAVEQLNLLRPEFIMSVGDLIEGGSRDKQQLAREWDFFDQRANRAQARIYRVGGNHDLTNSVMREVWSERYGPLYYHFIYRDTLFLVLNTEDLPPVEQDSLDGARSAAMKRVEAEGWGVLPDTPYAQNVATKTGWVSEQQASYFVDVIEQNPNVRWTFVFMHKPAWKRTDEKHFLAIEQSLEDRPYTVFYGHVHSYEHQSRFGRDYIQLGTTGGVQSAGKPMSVDHITLVTIDRDEPSIANLRLSGIFDKSGRIPLGGDEVCFEMKECGNE